MKKTLIALAIAAAALAGCGGGGGSSSPSVTPTATPTAAPSAPALSSVGFANATVSMTPGLALANPQAVSTSIPSSSFAAGLQPSGLPFSFSPGQGVVLQAAGGSTVPANTSISSVTITDNDTSGNTCLVYEKQGASSATPCPFTAAGRSVALTNSSDLYAVMYNNGFVPGAGFTISATAGSATAPAPQAVTVAPALISAGGPSVCCGTGSLVWESHTSKVYAAWSSVGVALASMSYSAAGGYGTPSLIAVTSINGSAASTLQSSPLDVIVGPDNNLWMSESNRTSTTHGIAVYLANSSGISPVTGNAVAPGAGAFLEYTLISGATGGGGNSKLTSIGTFGGYVWVHDNGGDIWRINPANGQVYPNLGTPYTLTANANPAFPMTMANGSAANSVLVTQAITVGSNFFAGGNSGVLAQINADTSSAPSNKCTGAANPCIATVSFPATLPGAPTAIATDGTNVYLEVGASLIQVSPSFAVTTAAQPFLNANGGLAQGADGWFWAQSTNQASSVRSMSASVQGPTAHADAAGACDMHGLEGFPGASFGNGFVLGPDNTLIAAVNAGQTPFCGVVY